MPEESFIAVSTLTSVSKPYCSCFISSRYNLSFMFAPPSAVDGMYAVLRESWEKQERLVCISDTTSTDYMGHFIVEITRDKEQAMPAAVGKGEQAEEASRRRCEGGDEKGAEHRAGHQGELVASVRGRQSPW